MSNAVDIGDALRETSCPSWLMRQKSTTEDTKAHEGKSEGVYVNQMEENMGVKARHRRPTAHARARYRCFLPDLAGLAGKRRAGPMPDNVILAGRECAS